MSPTPSQPDPASPRLDRLEELAMFAERQGEEFHRQLLELNKQMADLRKQVKQLEQRIESAAGGEGEEPQADADD